jgi:23S rRNA (cytidine1920-2'-O)/16S rRNA (cytidine1409-2'-O)-methyltransferase
LPRKARARFRALTDLVGTMSSDLDAVQLIASGRVVVDGRVVTNPASLVRETASVRITKAGRRALRGEAKLAAALEAFHVSAEGRVALDLGAAAGGFTRVLLRHGATRVYAVDTGYGQLLGSLRQNPAVVNLERTNLADLTPAHVPEPVALVVADLSYTALARALPQLNGRVSISPGADLVAVVKPQFELGLAEPPTRARQLAEAVERARIGAMNAGWAAIQVVQSPVAGARGSREFLLHGTRESLCTPPYSSRVPS